MEDFDNPEMEERWCEAQRKTVVDYLKSQGVNHGEVGEWPAWHVAPYVSIWAVESGKKRGWIGWWVICGDLPTDYISAADIESPQHPRKALQAIAERWLQYTKSRNQGKDLKDFNLGESRSFKELAPLLVSRANLLREWAQDDTLW